MHLDPSLLQALAPRRVDGPRGVEDHEVAIAVGRQTLGARFAVPERARGTVLLAHASGISRHSSRGRFVTSTLSRAGLATLVVDLLTEEEDDEGPTLRSDVPLLADRLVTATDWLAEQPLTADLPVGYFAEGAAAAGAVVAAALRPGVVQAIVSQDGRPELGGASLFLLRGPALLVVSGDDAELLATNRAALAKLRGERRLEVVPGTTRDGPGFDQLTALARDWFAEHLDASLLTGN